MHSKNILKRFHNHPSLIKIKQLVNNQTKFSFQPVSVHAVKEVIEIPIKISKKSGFIFGYLASCINEAISSGKFSDSLIVPVQNKAKGVQGTLLSKVFKK